MKNSTLVRQRHNYQIIQMYKLLKRIRHSTREELSKNIDISKSHLNKHFIMNDDFSKLKLSKMKGKELTKYLENIILKMINDFKNKQSHSIEEKEYFKKVKTQKQNTKKSLEGKNLSLEEFEKLNISEDEYISQYWTKSYKSENMNNRMKKRTLESLKSYTEILKNKPKVKKHLRNKTTRVQEQIIKIPVGNKIDFTENDLTEILKQKIKMESEKGNKILFSSFHLDESSNHIHLFIIDENFEIIKNNVKYINKKYNKKYIYEKMNDEELEEFGELLSKDDYDLCNSIMKKDNVEFKLRHEVHKNLSNEERKLKNKKIKSNSKYKNIQSNIYNNLNLKLEKIENSFKYHSNLSKNIINKFKTLLNEKDIKKQYQLKRSLESDINKIKSNKQKKEIKEVYNQIQPLFEM